MKTPKLDNSPRRSGRQDHVESWFVRANDPSAPRSVWIKATTLSSVAGRAVAEAWCSVFDGERTLGLRSTTRLDQATFREEPQELDIEVAGTTWRLHRDGGELRGEIASERGTVSWDLSFSRYPGPLGAPLCALPTRRMLHTKLPKNKLVTPFPVTTLEGAVTWNGDRWSLDGWHGMQGHNWGAAHAPEYAWGHCVFLDDAREPIAIAEGASGRIVVGGLTSPRLSMLVVRHADRELRFDRLVDLWRQRPEIEFPAWKLRIRGRHGEAAIAMKARPDRMVCLGYDNPSSPRSHCLNSKTAAVSLRVNPADDEPLDLRSEHGGALEFLQPAPRPDVQPVV